MTQDQSRLWVNLPGSNAAAAQNLKVTDLLTGPAVSVLRTIGDPNGTLTGANGQLALDFATGTIWQNQDDAQTWAVYITGGGGATVVTATPITGDGSPGSPVTYEDIAPGTMLGLDDDAPAPHVPVQLDPPRIRALIASDAGGDPLVFFNGDGDFTRPTGEYLGRKLITASGTYTPTAGTKTVRVRMTGGGGGGGGVPASTATAYAAGGGATGSYLEKFLSPGVAITGGAVVIGAAGTGAAAGANNGGAGGDTTIVVQGVTYTARGGGGGGGAAAVAAALAGQGGSLSSSSTAADLNGGGQGLPGVAFVGACAFGGAGGASATGTGGPAANQAGAPGSVPGNNATGKGGGGGGAAGLNDATARGGGTATGGVVIIDEWT